MVKLEGLGIDRDSILEMAQAMTGSIISAGKVNHAIGIAVVRLAIADLMEVEKALIEEISKGSHQKDGSGSHPR